MYGLCRDYTGFIFGLYKDYRVYIRGYIGIMEGTWKLQFHNGVRDRFVSRLQLLHGFTVGFDAGGQVKSGCRIENQTWQLPA